MVSATNRDRPQDDQGALASTITVRVAADEPGSAAKTSVLLPDAPELDKVWRIGKYPVSRLLGNGAMGRVYLGQHPELQLPVAIKVIDARHAADPRYRRRFLQEARLASQINHPNVVRVYDADQDGDTCFMVQEYVEGGDVAAWLRKDPGLGLPLHEALRIAKGVAAALVAAEKLAIVHRDVKPSNILLTREGEPKLADLGLARKVAPMGDTASTELTVTRTGSTVGTPAYMAPEQIMNPGAIDTRADLYALGATLFEMVTGQPPFPGSSTDEILRRHLHDPVPDPCLLQPGLPGRVGRLITQLLAKRPEERPPTATALLRELERVSQPFCRRPATGWWVAAAVLVATVVTAVALVRRRAALAAEKEGIYQAILSGRVVDAVQRAGVLRQSRPADQQAMLLSGLGSLLLGNLTAAESVRSDLAGSAADDDFGRLLSLQRQASVSATTSVQDSLRAVVEVAALAMARKVVPDAWTSTPKALLFLPPQASGVAAARLPEVAAWQDRIEAAMVERGPFPVVNRNAFDHLLRELAISASDLGSPEVPIALGRLLPAAVMLECIFSEENGLHLEVKLTDVETSQVFAMVAGDDLEPASRVAVVERLRSDLDRCICAHVPLQGRIVTVQGLEAEIDLGRWHGLQEGQRLTLYREKDASSPERLVRARPAGEAEVRTGGVDRLRATVELRSLGQRPAEPGMRVMALRTGTVPR